MFVSNVMQAYLPAKFLDSIESPGMYPIPPEVLLPREMAVNPNAPFNARFRGQHVLTITRTEAERLVAEGHGVYEEQKLLVYTVDQYLEDPDVMSDIDEAKKAAVAKYNGENLVAVAVIGGARGAVAVLRNIVSGCQKKENLVRDAEKALAKSNFVLIED